MIGLTLKSITLKNFLSVGNATQALRLNEHGLTLVLGNNGDANGVITKNGAGKSCILQALSYGLYGMPLTKIKIGNLVNNINQKAMLVVIDFERDDVQYRIERGKKPDVLRFYKNGEKIGDDQEKPDNDAKGENRETQRDIDNIVGMSHTMFKHIVALNTYTEPFLKETAAKQREIIEELLGVMQISNRADHLKQLIGQTKDQIKIEDAHVSATKAANTRLEAAIRAAERDMERWATKHQNNINDLQEGLEASQAIDFEGELKKFDDLDQWRKSERVLKTDRQYCEKELVQFQRDRIRLDGDINRAQQNADGNSALATINRLKRDLVRVQSTIETVQNTRDAQQAEANRLEDILSNPGNQECKTCGQELSGTDHLQYVIKRVSQDRDTAQQGVAAKLKEIAELENDITDIKNDIKARTQHLTETRDNAATVIENLRNELITVDLNITEKSQAILALDNDMLALGDKPMMLFETRDEVYQTKHAREILISDLERERNTANPFTGQVNGLQNSIQNIDMTVLNDAHDTLRHQDFLFKLLTSKDSFIRRKIIDQNLAYLNARMNHYLSKLGLPHEVVFQNDLSVEISLLGRDFDFAQLSRGEGNRVILATSWSFRDVWESLNHRVNLWFLDEILDNGSDGAAAESALQILRGFERNGRNVFLISHRDELVGRIENILTITKQNGFTSISSE